MKLNLNGLDVACIIGERADERTRLQHLRIDLALELDEKASETDELADTVDYAALGDRVRATLVAASCRMIERAARLVLDLCLAEPRVRGASVTVTKSGAVPQLESAAVTLEGARGA